ncbi:MAG: phosphatidate cytidylyltransferase [bacterium]|nr:phosphatidate cytidylyltransferase [bacterium]
MSYPVNILNPLENPILMPVLYRFLIVFLAGFLLILILNKLKITGLWKTNVGKRYLSWLVIGTVYLIAILFGGYFSLAILTMILIFAIWEVAKISKLPKAYVFALYLIGACSVIVAAWYTEYFYSLPLIYYLVLSFITIRQNDAKNGLFNTSISMFVSIWLIFSLAHFVLLGQLNAQLDSTRALLILIAFAVPLSDVCAYVFGRAFKKAGFFDRFKIASKLSPNKTYIGTLGNIIGAGIGIGIMFFAIESYLPVYHWIILSILIGVMGVAGDITESMFKRFFKVKDSSRIIPGHGGILDRIDSTLRVIVILYYYLLFFL